MKNVTAIIISFLRPGYTIACVESMKEQYEDINIIVGENGNYNEELHNICENLGVKYVMLPYDSGVCFARNELVRKVKTKYILVGDDDFYYDKKAMVNKMKLFLDSKKDFDLIGGRVTVNGILKNYQGFIEKQEKNFLSTSLDFTSQKFETDKKSKLKYCAVDLTFNYFVARTEKVKNVLWDEKIKVAYEHYSWFYDFKCYGGKVAFSPDPVVIHKPKNVKPLQDPQYSFFRNRKEDKERFFTKYGLDYTIGMNGLKTLAPQKEYKTLKTKKLDKLKFVDFCITTFKRPSALRRLIFSIIDVYPNANINIADQNEKMDRVFYKKLRKELLKKGIKKRFKVNKLPYDCGVSFARNYLVNTTPNMYKLILDDDMVFTEKTDIGKFIELLELNKNIGIVGGKVTQLGQDINFEFNLKIENETILQVPDGEKFKTHKNISYKKTGCVLNFCLIKKDLFNYILWDKDLKVSEHIDFYLRMKNVPYKILYTPEVSIDHPPIKRESDYKEFRQRKDYTADMLKKHCVKRVKYLNGQVVELVGFNELKRYKENI